MENHSVSQAINLIRFKRFPCSEAVGVLTLFKRSILRQFDHVHIVLPQGIV